jgi:hypothetical protein
MPVHFESHSRLRVGPGPGVTQSTKCPAAELALTDWALTDSPEASASCTIRFRRVRRAGPGAHAAGGGNSDLTSHSGLKPRNLAT